jgi:hypothetical protein
VLSNFILVMMSPGAMYLKVDQHTRLMMGQMKRLMKLMDYINVNRVRYTCFGYEGI